MAMKPFRFRASIYLDIFIERPEEAEGLPYDIELKKAKEQAEKITQQIVEHLYRPEEESLPDNFYNPYFGKVANLISGDLMGNSKRLDEI